MRTLQQQIKHILTYSLFIAAFSAPVFAEDAAETSHKDMHHAQKSLDWPGIYRAFLPCADCKGVKATLALNKNSSYLLITQYVGKSEREIVEKGKFTWGDKENVIVLTPRNGTTTQQYFVGEDMLIQLDNAGNRITGNLADRYTFRRSDMTQSSPSHAAH
ncbi:MAG: copper resistance protein NlpE [Methylobacter sp.]|nr:copper resistance protein NlpE [Methylobacter sp.]